MLELDRRASSCCKFLLLCHHFTWSTELTTDLPSAAVLLNHFVGISRGQSGSSLRQHERGIVIIRETLANFEFLAKKAGRKVIFRLQCNHNEIQNGKSKVLEHGRGGALLA